MRKIPLTQTWILISWEFLISTKKQKNKLHFRQKIIFFQRKVNEWRRKHHYKWAKQTSSCGITSKWRLDIFRCLESSNIFKYFEVSWMMSERPWMSLTIRTPTVPEKSYAQKFRHATDQRTLLSLIWKWDLLACCCFRYEAEQISLFSLVLLHSRVFCVRFSVLWRFHVGILIVVNLTS